MRKLLSILSLWLIANNFPVSVCAFETPLINSQIDDNSDSYFLGDDGVYYSIPEAEDWNDNFIQNGEYEITELLTNLINQDSDGKFAVRIWIYGKNVSADLQRLEENGIKLRGVDINGKEMLYSVLNAEQLQNFPVSADYGYKIGLSPLIDNTGIILSEEIVNQALENYKNCYCLGKDDIFYACIDDFIWDEYDTRRGTYDMTNLLLVLVKKYPEGKFAVKWWSEGKYQGYEYELNRLKELGITAIYDSNTRLYYGILESEQLRYFPASEYLGYKMGLAENVLKVNDIAYSPVTLSGDINSDGKVDLTDLTGLSLALVDNQVLTENQIKAADINKNGNADLTDLATLKQYLSKQIESLG